MPWKGPGRRYYYQSQRVGKRIVYTYVGAGEVPALIAQYDAIERERRDLERYDRRQERERFLAQTSAPAELDAYSAAVRGVVAGVLRDLGFHQHRRQWRLQRMTTDNALTVERARELFVKRKLTSDERAELRAILSEQTALARHYGSMAGAVWNLFMKEADKQAPGFRVAADAHRAQLRVDFGYDESSEMERLLIDEIALRQFDYYRVERAYVHATNEAFSLAAMEQWDQTLDRKQRMFLRAIKTLAEVRRLLRLPSMQVNIAAPNSQQVNVAGSVQV